MIDYRLIVGGSKLPELPFMQRLKNIIGPFVGFGSFCSNIAKVFILPSFIDFFKCPVIYFIKTSALQARQRLQGGSLFIVVSDDNAGLGSDPRPLPTALQLIYGSCPVRAL